LTKLKQVVLFTSQSGIDIGNSLSNLNAISGQRAEVVRAEGERIGDKIRVLPISKDLLDYITSRYQKSVEVIRDSRNDIAFVSVHCCFRTRSAFHSSIEQLVNLLLQSKIRVRGIVTLIDDFYSTYFRIREYYRTRSIREGMNPLDILYWRNIDLMMAHMLANQLQVGHYVVSVNHPLSLLKRLTFDRHTTVYAGHPITDIRRLGEEQRQRMIRRVNEEQILPLSTRPELVTFIPDTIDEAPILGLPQPNPPESEPPRTLEEHKRRIWPKSWLDSDPPIAAQVPDDIAARYYDELLTNISRNGDMYREAAYGQISDRDYRLVNQSTNFVFSLFREIPSSAGVEAELTQTKRYPDKSIYFFNPDSIQSVGGGVRPNWATQFTGENSSMDELIRILPLGSDQPLLNV